MAVVILEGSKILSEADLHRKLEAELPFGEYYGRNLAALRDRLLLDIPRPVTLVWNESDVSRRALGDDLFGDIVEIFTEAAEQDEEFGLQNRFTFELH